MKSSASSDIVAAPTVKARRHAVPRIPPGIEVGNLVLKWPDEPPPPDNPTLVRANVTFHTNDDDKDHDIAVGIYVVLRAETIAYIYDEFGHFPDQSDAGPYTLILVRPLPRHAVKQAHVVVGIDPVVGPIGGAGDTWRFNFVLDLVFQDGSHQLARASGLELSTWNRTQEFGIE
jgi:hypothetical protein